MIVVSEDLLVQPGLNSGQLSSDVHRVDDDMCSNSRQEKERRYTENRARL